MNCPSCKSEDVDSRRIDECSCGWAQTTPIEQSPERRETGYKKCGCGLTWGTVHRFDGPCYQIEKPKEPAGQKFCCDRHEDYPDDKGGCAMKSAEQEKDTHYHITKMDFLECKRCQPVIPPLPREVEAKIQEIYAYHHDGHVLKETASLDQRFRELCELMRKQG